MNWLSDYKDKSNIIWEVSKKILIPFDEKNHEDFSQSIKGEKAYANEEQTKKVADLYKQLEEREVQEKLFDDIFGWVTQSELEKLDKFQNMSAEDFDQWDSWYRSYEANKEHLKAAKYSMYYILNQRKDNNTNWPYNDLLYRHVAQNLLRANEHHKAEKILRSVRNLSIDWWRKAIDDVTYRASMAFASHDIQWLEQLQISEEASTLDEFNKNTLDAMVILWRQWIWDYGKVYWWL